MKSFVLAVTLALAAAHAHDAGAAGPIAGYVNARFGYSIDYPADFLAPEREADNSDGRAFHARRGVGKMSVWGASRSDDDLDSTPAAIFRRYEADCEHGRVTYKIIKPRLVAFSCVTPMGKVIYQKTLVGHDVLRSVRLEYPSSDQATWAPIVQQVSNSLHATSR